jgi:hypothetical protein
MTINDKFKYAKHGTLGVQGKKSRTMERVAVGFLMAAAILAAAVLWYTSRPKEAKGESLIPLPPLCAHADIVCPGEYNPPIHKVKYVEAYITHYRDRGITASGQLTYEGGVACPRSYAFNTKVLIAGTTFVCNDHYAKWVDENRGEETFDIYVNETIAQALQFGIHKEKVEIIEN